MGSKSRAGRARRNNRLETYIQPDTWYPQGRKKRIKKIPITKSVTFEGELYLDDFRTFKYFRVERANRVQYVLWIKEGEQWRVFRKWHWPNWAEVTNILGKYLANN